MDNNSTSFFDDQPIFIVDQHSLNIIDVNESAIAFYGFSRSELCSMNITDLGFPKGKEEIEEQAKVELFECETVWQHTAKSGSQRYVQFTSHPFNYEGRAVKLVVAHDVTNEVEEQKEQSEFPKIDSSARQYLVAEIDWNPDFTVKRWSGRAEEFLGWTAEEVYQQKDFWSKFISAKKVDPIKRELETAIEQGQSYASFDAQINTHSGDTVKCRWHNYLIYDHDEELKAIHSFLADISQKNQSENLFRALAEKSLVGVYLIQDNVFKYVNPEFSNIFGYSREEITGKLSPGDLTHPDDRSTVAKNLRLRLQGEEDAIQYEFRCVTKGNDVIDVIVYGAAITYMGKPAIVGTLLDITENKETMRKYQASLKTFEDLFDSITDAIYIQDEQGRFLEVNQGAVDMYGYDKSFFIGKTPEMLAAPGKVDMEATQKKVEKALNGSSQSFEWWGQRKNGEIFPKEVIVNPGTYFGEDAVIAIARDISDRYKAEQKLRKNEEMFRQLFQNAPVPIAMLDKRQEVEHVNEAFEDTFGYQTNEVKGLNIDNFLVPEEEQAVAREVSQKIFSGETAFHTGKRLCKDGSVVDVLIYGVPVNVANETVAIFGIFVDITDRKQAEEKVKKSLKEKEVLLAEIHHRVKNNLAVITGLLELQAYNTDSDEATEVLTASQMRVNSIALIHEKLYQNKNLSEISFDTYLRELTDVIVSSMHSAQTDVSITINTDPVELTISQAIPCGLILNELITNAYKHAFNDQDEGDIVIDIANDAGNISLVVTDNGTGIPEDISVDNPKSLGIKLIHTLSNQLGGEAEFSRTENGTRFTLEFELEE